jgi:hypothetical protein
LSFTLTLLAHVAAQLDREQHAAVRVLLTDLGCTPPTCPNFAANESCPGVLDCSNGRVNYISLTMGVGRTGSINGPALGVLTGLTYLQLFNLNLTTIPTQVGRLSALQALVLSSSALIGTVPTEVANLANLETLNLNGNKLIGTLPALDKLTKLTNLITNHNVGLGGNMPAMPTSIRTIFVQNCSFTGLPPNLSALTVLSRLYVHQNKLSGAPPVVPLSVSLCTLQIIGDSNCLACPANRTFGPCTCIPNSNVTACASLATTTTVAALPGTSQSAAIVTTASTTTVRATPGTAMAASTAPATSTTAPTSSTATSASTAALSATITPSSSAALEPWVLGVIVGGAVLALILVGVAVFFLLKRRRARQPPTEKPAAAQPQSNYAPINVTPPGDYTQGRLDSNDDQPAPSNYAVIPAKSSDYDNGRMNVDGAAAASEYNVGRLS